MHGGVSRPAAKAWPGQCFTVRLPAMPAQALTLMVQPADDLSAERTSTGPALRILVVDDNQDSAISMTLLLELQGHEVHVAHAGQTALRVATDKRPDVILLDIGMPGMNGYEVARQLRAQNEFADTLLVAITGYGRASDVMQTQSAASTIISSNRSSYDKLQAVLSGHSRGARFAARD